MIANLYIAPTVHQAGTVLRERIDITWLVLFSDQLYS